MGQAFQCISLNILNANYNEKIQCMHIHNIKCNYHKHNFETQSYMQPHKYVYTNA